MVFQRTPTNHRSRAYGHRKGLEGILCRIVQIVMFFVLCYLLIVFHYELVQSKAHNRDMTSRVAKLETQVKNVKYSNDGAIKRTQPKTIVHKNKPVDIFGKRKKRNTNEGEPALIHTVAVETQRMNVKMNVRDEYGSAYLTLKQNADCSPVCLRSKGGFVVNNNEDYIQVGSSGYYQVYAQVNCDIPRSMSKYMGHSIEIQSPQVAGHTLQRVHFTSTADPNSSRSSHYTGGIICIEANSFVRVKVKFRPCRKSVNPCEFTITCSKEQTFLGLIRIRKVEKNCFN